MREILFRGKCNSDNEWAYGYYVGGSTTAPYDEIFEPTDGVCWNRYVVDPETVGQYTGMTGADDVKIFEGDICDFSVFDYNGRDTQYRGVVTYDGSRFMLWKSVESEFYGSDGGFDLDWVVAQDDEITVIGNRLDNPELLEATK